jgi:N-methylhydantoinase A/oxoprolinase/acetone carboxylase beta subunit
VPLGGDLAESFHQAHEERYGSVDREREIELVAIRTADVRHGPKIEPSRSTRKDVTGPTMLELDGSTCWLPAGWVGARDGAGWRLTRT